MTIESVKISPIVVLSAELTDCVQDPLAVFTLPHPTNNESKGRVKLIQAPNGKIFQLKSHTFSKSCQYNDKADLAEDRYHYTGDGQPLKSIFLTNESDRNDGHVFESGDFQFTAAYDVAFNLIGFYYRESITRNENEYVKSPVAVLNSDVHSAEPKCFTARDYHDFLVDNHDKEWSKVSLDTLQNALSNVAELIDEAGEIYYKITPQRITSYLAGKVQKILQNFPKSLPIPTNLPEHVRVSFKTIMSANLLISLIPKLAYQELKSTSPHSETALSDAGIAEVNIPKAFSTYQTYEKSKSALDKEQEMQLRAAMTVGLSTSSVAPAKKAVKKNTVNAKKIKVISGKGSIDGFFRKAK